MDAMLPTVKFTQRDTQRLLRIVQELSQARDLDGVMAAIRRAARDLTDADGVTFVLRDGDQVFYAEENAIAPLWKGRRFPVTACISGWSILHRQPVAIEDVYVDSRVPPDAYRATFVRSLLMVPIRPTDPLGAIGAYWATRHVPTEREIALQQALANSTAVALANVELLRDLQRAVRVRDDFIGIASHELKTPLTPLKLQVQGLARTLEKLESGGLDASPVRHGLARVEGNVRRLERLVESLLDFSRISHEGLRLEIEEVDLAAVAADAVERFRPEAEEAGTPVSLRAERPVRGWFDGARLELAVGNLLSNAIKYGARQPVRVTVHDDNGSARVSVRDEGIGIPLEDQARIFERFERAVPSSHYGGFGLGLWIVRKVAEAHGGSVHLESEPGSGSTFTLVLPRARAAFI